MFIKFTTLQELCSGSLLSYRHTKHINRLHMNQHMWEIILNSCYSICTQTTNSCQSLIIHYPSYSQSLDCSIYIYMEVHKSLEDQHMEWKPAGQPEHASLNQCQLIVANRCSGHPQQVVEIRFLCNVIDAGALIGPCSHVTSCCCLIC